MKERYIYMSIDEMPKYWYNILPDLPEPLPPFKDPDGEVSRIELMRRIFTKSSLELEFSTDRWIPIPEEVWELYVHVGRPRPLCRAKRLEEFLNTPAEIYYKREDLSPTGSFKINSMIPQVYYAYKEGFKEVVAPTGAGQVGSAVAYATRFFSLDSTIFWVRHACEMKPHRKWYTEMLGARVFESPSGVTKVGRSYLMHDSKHPGSLGIAYAEAFEYVLSGEGRVAIWGSRMNHVIMHHTIIGLETKIQLEKVDREPDIVLSCGGTGSNFPGLAIPFMKDYLDGKLSDCRFLMVQSTAAPTLIKGEYRYDFMEPSKTLPMMKMYTLGVDAKLPIIKAEGLRSTSSSPLLSLLRKIGLVDAVAVEEGEALKAAKIFLQTEGILVALESAYAIKAAIDEALAAKREGERKVIVLNISGSGYFDMEGYKDVIQWTTA